MSNQDYLATAFVQIRPKVTGFQKELRDQINKAIKPIKPTVNVAPTTKGFSAALRAQVRDAIKKSGKHTVPVIPTVGAFRAQLSKELSAKPVPVQVVAAGGGTKAAVGGETQLRDVQATRKQITRDLANAEKLLDAALKAGVSDKQRDVLVSKAQALARKALLDVTLRQAGTERTLAAEQLKIRAARVSTRAESAAAAPGKAAAASETQRKATQDAAAADKAAKAEKEALRRISDKLILSFEGITKATRDTLTPTQKLKQIESELTRVLNVERDLQLELQSAIRGGNAARQTSIRLLLQQAAETKTLAQANIQNLNTEIQSTSIERQQLSIRGALNKALAIEISTLTDVNAVREQTNALKKISRDLEKLETAATEQNAAATIALVDAMKLEVGERQTLLAQQKKSITQTQLESTKTRNLARGGGATALSRLGARGATLAAGSEFLIGAAAVTAFAKAVESAANLETQLNVFRVTAGATADEMVRVSETAKQLGSDITLPAVNASDAAEAFTDLAKAGLSVRDSIDGARGVLQLATAAQIENSEATELVASGLNAFGLAGIEATHVADLLTGAANEAQGSIGDMGIALQQSSAVARQAGLSIEDTVSFITLLAQAGIRGSDAGTSLRTALLRLISPTDQAQKILKQLGISVLDAQGAINPTVFAQLQQALAGLEPVARNQTLRKIFGQDAIRAAVIFGREGTAGLNQVRDAIDQMGLASQLAQARTAGFAGKVEAFKNAAATLGVSIGQVAIPALEAIVDNMNQVVSAANDAATGIQFLIDKVEQLPGIGKSERGGGKGGFFEEVFGKLTQGPRDIFENQINKPLEETLQNLQRGKNAPLQFFTGFRSAKEAAQDTDTLFKRFRAGRATLDDVLQAQQELRREIRQFGTAKVPEEFLNSQKRLETLVKNSSNALRDDLSPALTETRTTMQGFAIDTADAASRQAILKDAIILTAGAMDLMIDAGERANHLANLPPPPEPAARLTGAQVLNRLSGFDAQKIRAEIHGSDEELLAVLQAENAFIEQQLQRQIAKKQPGLRRALEQAQLSVLNDIEAISDKRKKDAQDAADKIEDDNKERAQAILRGFGIAEQKIINQETVAAQTEGLKDDLQADKDKLRLYLRQRVLGLKQIKDAEALRDFLAEINQKIFDVQQEIKSDRKALNQSIRQQQRENRERIQTGIELDIEFFEITENKSAEIAARKKLIKALQDQIQHERGNTNKIKELRNEIARQKQAIKEAQKEEDDRRNAFKGLLFSFLQTQQGFAANLLGNLIPGFATRGLVGGTSPTIDSSIPGLSPADIGDNFTGPGPLLPQEHGRGGSPAAAIPINAEVSSARGRAVKPGQVDRTNQILEAILRVLQGRPAQPPEIVYNRQHGGSMMDMS